MSTFLIRNFKLVAVAVVTAALTAGGPAIAHGVRHALFAHNSDKVDHKHAVGYRSSSARRQGKLVATSKTSGRLPNDIISKAPNADELDGIESANVLPGGILPRGSTIRGYWELGWTADAAGEFQEDAIAFGFTLRSSPTPHLIPDGDPAPPACPGGAQNPQANPGHLCVYERSNNNATATAVCNFDTCPAATRWGAALTTNSVAAGGVFIRGTWAVTAP